MTDRHEDISKNAPSTFVKELYLSDAEFIVERG